MGTVDRNEQRLAALRDLTRGVAAADRGAKRARAVRDREARRLASLKTGPPLTEIAAAADVSTRYLRWLVNGGAL